MSYLEVRQEKDLNNIREKMVSQADLVAIAVEQAVQAVQTGDHKLAHAVVLRDHPINRNMRTIDRLCHSFIAVHLPSAGPLRLLSSIIRANVELERIGDYAVTIARESIQMSTPPKGGMGHELDRIAAESLFMLRQAVKAFKELNAELARGTMAISEQLENDMNIVYEELISNTERAEVKNNLAVFVIFNQLKRVADQAKNLCEHTIFAVTGEEKAAKVYRILFLDRNNSLFGPLAAAIASSGFPIGGIFESAGKESANALDARLVDFMKERGLSVSDHRPQALSPLIARELSKQQVVVCLEGGIEEYLDTLPFHTAVQEWDLGDAENMEDVYREIASRTHDLMELLRGEGAD